MSEHSITGCLPTVSPLIADELRYGPIDVVLPWVDGSDPELAARRARYAQGDALVNEEVGGSTRYASVGEIRWCVASLLRFAPFVRKIFILRHFHPYRNRQLLGQKIKYRFLDHHLTAL